MATFIQRFPEYKNLIIRSINSCENTTQLFCAYDMIDRFIDVFKFGVDQKTMSEAVNEMHHAYTKKTATITIL